MVLPSPKRSHAGAQAALSAHAAQAQAQALARPASTVAASEAAAAAAGANSMPAALEPVAPAELIERRRVTRPIPIAQVIEATDDDGWELWHQWSQPS